MINFSKTTQNIYEKKFMDSVNTDILQITAKSERLIEKPARRSSQNFIISTSKKQERRKTNQSIDKSQNKIVG